MQLNGLAKSWQRKKNPLAAAAARRAANYRGMTGAMPRRRKATQLLLLAINIYIAITFWYWVRYYETAGSTTFVARPGGIEGWLPIAGLMNLKYSLATGQLPSIHAAAMLLLVAFIVISLLLKRPFVHGYARLVRFRN